MRYAIFIAAGIFFSAIYVHAGLEDVTYPIAELGSCESQEACFAYCDLSENYDACMAFAEVEEILSTQEIQEYRQVQEVVSQGGPGGCTSESECEAYCGDLTNIQECLSFAQEYGLMSEEELAEAQKVQAALDAGYTLPGGCIDEASCDLYCSDASHMEECLAFGQAAGFISDEEVVQAQKFLTSMESGSTPGGCQNKQECEAYCADGANADECLNFAVETGFMTQEEADTVREMGMQPGEEFRGPGGCTDEESCRTYCEQESNQEECSAFFGDRGGEFEGEGGQEKFVGPGGCVGEDACRAYCSDPANQETCAAFFGETQPVEEYESGNEYQEYDSGQPQGYPSEEYPPEYEGGSEYGEYPGEYEYDGGEGIPDYQYEGEQNYDIYEYGDEGSYNDDEFELFEPGDEFFDVDQGGENYGDYDEIYVEPPSGYDEQPSFSEPWTPDDFGAPPSDSSGPPADSGDAPADSGDGESHSAANAGFVNFARQLLGKVINLLRI